MIIVSQGGVAFLNLDSVSMVYADEDGVYCRCMTDGTPTVKLGAYKSLARSQEVLKEIVNEYRKYLTADGLTGVNGFPPFAYTQPKVYEMPEE
jgi:hypothetical protein